DAQALAAKMAAAAEPDKATLRAEIDKLDADVKSGVERAFAAAKAVVTRDPDSVAAQRLLADYYRVMKAKGTMQPLLDKVRAAASGDPRTAYVLGASVADDPTLVERAIRYFDEALEAEPQLHRARYKLARVFQGQGNVDKAVAHL